MKGRSPPFELVLGHGREQVLAGVLLHMIEAAGPVQLEGSWTFRDGDIEKMEKFALALLDLHHGHTIDRAKVTGLPSPSG